MAHIVMKNYNNGEASLFSVLKKNGYLLYNNGLSALGVNLDVDNKKLVLSGTNNNISMTQRNVAKWTTFAIDIRKAIKKINRIIIPSSTTIKASGAWALSISGSGTGSSIRGAIQWTLLNNSGEDGYQGATRNLSFSGIPSNNVRQNIMRTDVSPNCYTLVGLYTNNTNSYGVRASISDVIVDATNMNIKDYFGIQFSGIVEQWYGSNPTMYANNNALEINGDIYFE